MLPKHIILGVHVLERVSKAPDIQKLFTEYGCHIKTRIGLHDVNENVCSVRGLILLELFGDETQCQALYDKLSALEGVEVQRMVFEH